MTLNGIVITEETYRASYRAMAAWQKIYTSPPVDPARRLAGAGLAWGQSTCRKALRLVSR